MTEKPFHRSDVHKQKFKKNVAVGFILLGFIALIFAITVVKLHLNAG